jgi:ribonuclease III
VLAERIGYTFVDRKLIELSVAHRSWSAEFNGLSNERLEFLGDAVLGLIVTNHMYRAFPDLPEGDLAKMRSGIVNANSLAAMARELELGRHMRLGKGEFATGGRDKTSILADALEAVIGAVYLDGGWEEAERLVMNWFGDRIGVSAAGPGGDDYKTRLQELCAHKFEMLPSYRVTDEGPDHAKEFHAIVIVLGEQRGEGDGKSKKAAEQIAARQAWEALVAEIAHYEALGVPFPRPDLEIDLLDNLTDDRLDGSMAAEDLDGNLADGSSPAHD